MARGEAVSNQSVERLSYSATAARECGESANPQPGQDIQSDLRRLGRCLLAYRCGRTVTLGNMRRSAFQGTLYLVNPGHASLNDLPVHPNVASLPETPDLAIIATPPDRYPR